MRSALACASTSGTPGPGIRGRAQPPGLWPVPSLPLHACTPGLRPQLQPRAGLRQMLPLPRGGQAAQSLPRTPLGRGWVLPSERGLPGRRRRAIQPPQWPRTPLGMFQKGTGTPLHSGAGVGCGGTRAPSARSGRLGAPVGVPGGCRRGAGTPTPAPRYLGGAAGRPSGCGSACSSARGWGGQRRCEGARFPAPRPAEKVSQLPRGNARKKRKNKRTLPPHASGWRFCLCYCQGGGQKAKLSRQECGRTPSRTASLLRAL